MVAVATALKGGPGVLLSLGLMGKGFIGETVGFSIMPQAPVRPWYDWINRCGARRCR
jgi:hypothetical protein